MQCKVCRISHWSASSDWQCVIEISCESSVSVDVEHNTVSLYVATIYLVLWCRWMFILKGIHLDCFYSGYFQENCQSYPVKYQYHHQTSILSQCLSFFLWLLSGYHQNSNQKRCQFCYNQIQVSLFHSKVQWLSLKNKSYLPFGNILHGSRETS